MNIQTVGEWAVGCCLSAAATFQQILIKSNHYRPTANCPLLTFAAMDHPVILFDGVCNLCNRSVQFIIKRDKKSLFRFASLQGKAGQDLLKQYDLPYDTLYSFVLIENGKAYTRSTATLRVLRKLGGGWKLLYGLIILPPFIRNAIYNWIARNRYKWYGKKEECMVPTPELKSRFLD